MIAYLRLFAISKSFKLYHVDDIVNHNYVGHKVFMSFHA